ncbi:MAG: UDP-N-acetylmuramoyl-tripeptide--D-alanyl-D-alanine ligase [Piscirickettsiaceae bacterium]|nr:UDP-N-acetylmuramoyl-tripeptide--D-alanyl-D-alanine ligase [Piscirickettsiaceae bacterium]
MSMQFLLSQIADVLGCVTPEHDVTITGAVIDSRKVEAGNLFIALPGEHVDGHDYIAVAREAGASAALVSRLQDDELPQIVVDDIVNAFGVLTQYWRQQCKAIIVAITGSNGKTTVKEMVASILSQHGSVVATVGNFNNELGVPLTLARLDKESDYAVIEMGANHAGEIARLVEIVNPQIALINNVAAAHLEGFGDITGVASAKEEIYAGLASDGIAVVNADMRFSDDWQSRLTNKNVVTFALENDADITAKDLQTSSTSSHFMVALNEVLHYVNLPLPGKHNVANALAAIAITHALNIPETAIIKGLALMKSVPHRLQIRAGLNQSQLIDDSYNANPGSYQQALHALHDFSGEHWLVLGDFGELGSDSASFHYQMGLDAKTSGVTRLFTIGVSSQNANDAFGEGAQHFDDMTELQQQLQQELTTGVTCLIKGSRFMQLDTLADVLAIEGED